MANEGQFLPHITVLGMVESRGFNRAGGGGAKVRVVPRSHGSGLKSQLLKALQDFADEKLLVEVATDLEELEADGSVIILEGADAAYPIKIDSLEQWSRHRVDKKPKWLLLSVHPAVESQPERAVVWVSDDYRRQFIKLFEDFLTKETTSGEPKNRELVANIGRIRSGVLLDLWQSDGEPPSTGTHWWEVWLRPAPEALPLARKYAEDRGFRISERHLSLNDRTVIWLRATWSDLQTLPFTLVPVAEIRLPQFVDTFDDLTIEEQEDYVTDLADRIVAAPSHAPAVCHLDTGVRRSHALLRGSLDDASMFSIVGSSHDQRGHGTQMAGLGLYGPLDGLLTGVSAVTLTHRLESVKFLPDPGLAGHDEDAYGLVTAQAVALPEAESQRRRVYCMPITAKPEKVGVPSLWSASVDALAAGTDIGQSPDGVALLGAPDPASARLILISAGNVDEQDLQVDYRSTCDTSPIADPAQSWNALTVGAHTELNGTPSDPTFEGWTALADPGGISPHSRTSMNYGKGKWPFKPEICMEGGNLLTDGSQFIRHPLVELRTTGSKNDSSLASTNATSAATAQAARLAAMAMARYPDYWPETVRGLLVHAADWTNSMRADVDAAPSRTARLSLLRRFGWGVPSQQALLESTKQAVTLVTQDEFTPFDGDEYAARQFRLHRLPWPADALRQIGEGDVQLRVTLSYFIEPSASRRGWRKRHTYQSHGLRFELKSPLESIDAFVARVNREAAAEEDGASSSATTSDRWLIGANQRNTGSLHQDVWTGSGPELADCGVLAVHPVGGWWKNRKAKDRVDCPVRYSLVVSLRTWEAGVDLYTPIAVQVRIPVESILVEAT